jgi:hypothetical protein
MQYGDIIYRGLSLDQLISAVQEELIRLTRDRNELRIGSPLAIDGANGWVCEHENWPVYFIELLLTAIATNRDKIKDASVLIQSLREKMACSQT